MYPPPNTTYVRSDVGHVAYQVFGGGPSPVLFVSSWAQNLDVMWDEPRLARYLDRLGSFGPTIAYDKRGHGVSDPVPLTALPTIEAWMDDARVVLDAVGVERVALIGDTEGGPIGATFAATYPERVSHLVLINSYARWRRDDDYPIGMPDEVWNRLTSVYEENWGVTSAFLDATPHRWPMTSHSGTGI